MKSLFKIGADIEFLMLTPSFEIQNARDTLQENNEIGYDGHAETGELRPAPADIPEELYENIKTLLKKLNNKIDRKTIVKGGCYFNTPIGGHIHFSFTPEPQLVRMLDVFAALPIMMIEPKSESELRKRAYGGLGDIRYKEWGFEYRTLHSFITNPFITKLSLILSYITAYQFMESSLNELDYYDSLYYTIINTEKFFMSDKNYYRKFMNIIFNELKKFKLYKRYKQYILKLKGLINNKITFNTFEDVLVNWGIRKRENLLLRNKNLNIKTYHPLSIWKGIQKNDGIYVTPYIKKLIDEQNKTSLLGYKFIIHNKPEHTMIIPKELLDNEETLKIIREFIEQLKI